MKISTLKELIEHLPEDYNIEFKNNDDIISPVSDIIEIDTVNKRLIFKK